jgi:hypothetical protein
MHMWDTPQTDSFSGATIQNGNGDTVYLPQQPYDPPYTRDGFGNSVPVDE